MKPLFLILALLFATQSIAVAPYGFKGQYQTATQYSNVLQFPNRSVVKTGGINSLVDTSENLLYNGSIESATLLDGWTCTNSGGFTAETSEPLDGNKSLKVQPLTVGGHTCYQDFNINQNQRGQSLLLSAMVRASGSDTLQICYRENGVATSICSQAVSNGIPSTEAVIGSSATSIGYQFIIPYNASGLNIRMDKFDMRYGTAVTNQPAIGPETPYTPVFSNVNTPTNINFTYQQIGSNLLIKGYYTGSGGTATNEVRIGLPVGMTTSSKINPIQSLGTLNSSYSTAFDGQSYILGTANKNYLNVGLFSSGTSGLSVANVSAIGFSNGRNYSFEVLVPVNELASSVPTYTGRCSNKRNCKTIFTAIVDNSCNITGNDFGFFSGCSGTTTKTLNFYKTLSNVPNCGSSAIGGTGSTTANVSSITTSSFSTTSYAGATGNASGITVWCELTGKDFEDAFTLQQNVALKSYVQTPNTTGKVGFCSAKISATGVISDHLGGCFASCTNATTPVCTFTSNYWRSGSVPNCWTSISPAAGYAPSNVDVTTTTMSGLMVNTSWGAQGGARTYICHGEIQ